MTNDFFERELENTLTNKTEDVSAVLREAMHYALFSGGKRIRPTLVFTSADFFDKSYEEVLPLALALECIHSYSLVHDDMPCMDDDETRRGQPTVHKKYGEAIALLCGDALLNLAYEILLDAAVKNKRILPSCALIASCAGVSGMVGGQAMEFDGTVFTHNNVTVLDKKKTGALFYAALVAPSLLSDDRQKQESIARFAEKIGLAFQISDDLIDVEKEEKTSYPVIFGVDYAKETLRQLYDGAKEDMRIFGKKGDALLLLFHKAAFRHI